MVHHFQLSDGRWANVYRDGEWLYFGQQFKLNESVRLFVLDEL